MTAYLLRRLTSLTLTVILTSIVVFAVLEVLPGDPAQVMLGTEARPDTLRALRAQMGLDAPVLVRYGRWVGGMVVGDFGQSYTYKVPVAELLGPRLAVTLPLSVLALLLSTALALPLGFLAAANPGRPQDWAVIGFSQLGLSVPNFWLAILLVLLFAVRLRWFASGGFPGWSAGYADAVRALILPAVAIALPQAAILARVTRSAVLETIGLDYVRTARAKGLGRAATLRRHVLRNALIPVTTIVGLQLAFLVAGAIVIENVFYLPGLGRLLYQAIAQRDLVVVEDVVVLLALIVAALSFLTDLVHAAIDPRPKVIR